MLFRLSCPLGPSVRIHLPYSQFANRIRIHVKGTRHSSNDHPLGRKEPKPSVFETGGTVAFERFRGPCGGSATGKGLAARSCAKSDWAERRGISVSRIPIRFPAVRSRCADEGAAHLVCGSGGIGRIRFYRSSSGMGQRKRGCVRHLLFPVVSDGSSRRRRKSVCVRLSGPVGNASGRPSPGAGIRASKTGGTVVTAIEEFSRMSSASSTDGLRSSAKSLPNRNSERISGRVSAGI